MSTSVVLKQNQGYLSTLPVGSIIAWHRDLLEKEGFHLPPGWVTCDGQKLEDEESLLNGHTIPNLNGEGRFLRGGKESGTLQNQDWKSFSVAGFGQGLYTHSDVLIPKEGYNTTYPFGGKWESVPGSGGSVANRLRFKFDTSEVRPINMSVVWIMKIKQVATAQAVPAVLTEPNAPEGTIYVDRGGNVTLGRPGYPSALTVNGPLIRSMQMASGLGPNDGTDKGQIKSRILKIHKLFKETSIRILYCDNLRVNGDDAAARWEIRVNGTAPPGGAIFQDMYANSGNHHHPSMIMGYASGLPAGDHEIQVWVGALPGRAEGDAFTGWSGSRWTIEAQEVFVDEPGLDFGGIKPFPPIKPLPRPLPIEPLPFEPLPKPTPLEPLPIPGPIDWSKVDMSKVDVTTIDMSKIDASKLDAAAIDASKIDASKLDATAIDASKIDAAKLDATAIDASKIDAAKLDATAIDASKIDAAKLDATAIDASKIDAAKLDATAIDASKIDAAKLDATAIDASKIDAAKLDATAIDASKIDAAKLDATAIDASKIDAAKLDVSKIDLSKIRG